MDYCPKCGKKLFYFGQQCDCNINYFNMRISVTGIKTDWQCGYDAGYLEGYKQGLKEGVKQ